jgi:hypothetical protein
MQFLDNIQMKCLDIYLAGHIFAVEKHPFAKMFSH